MLLTFVRHAEASSGAASDFERRLTQHGKNQAAQLAAFYATIKYPPELILSSPVVRARQTAEVIKQRLESATFLEQAWLSCGMNPENCLCEISSFTRFKSILLVGHEPDLSKTIAFLLGSPNLRSIPVVTASICALEIPSFGPGTAALQYFLPPDLLPSLSHAA